MIFCGLPSHLVDFQPRGRNRRGGGEFLSTATCVLQARDFEILQDGGRVQLSSKLEPGDYVLQVVVTDNLAKDKYRIATPAMDFEVRK